MRGQVDASVLEVGHGAGGPGQVVHVQQGEAHLLRHPRHRAVGQRAARVAGVLDHLLRDGLELRVVVVPGLPLQAQLGVGPPGLLGGRDGQLLAPGQLLVQADQLLEHGHRQLLAGFDGRHAQGGEERPALRPVERDLQRGATRRRLRAEQLAHRHAQRFGDGPQEAEAGFAPSVLDEGQEARRRAHLLAQGVEREPLRGAQVPDAAAQRDQVRLPADPHGASFVVLVLPGTGQQLPATSHYVKIGVS